MDVQILGPLRVLRDGVELDLGRPKQRLLLAVLVAAGGDTVSVDRLVDELWGEAPPPRVAASVQAYVSKLRNVLEPDRPARSPARLLVTRAPGYALHLDLDQLDAAHFSREAAEVRQHLQARRFERAYATSGQALDRWRGDVLADLADEPVAERERPRWHELRLTVTEDRLHAAVELGLHATAVADLEQLLADHPLREGALGLLLRSLYLAGRPVEALERYRGYRTQLQDELGLDPGLELQAVEAAILRQDPSLLPAVPEGPLELRSSVTSAATDDGATDPEVVGDDEADGLVGRDAELAVGTALVRDVQAGRMRWMTLVGEAGIGKTRVAEAVADRATAAGLEVAWGRCHDDDAAPAYWPWSQLLRGWVEDATDPIAVLLDDQLTPDPGARRYQLHERVGEVLLSGGPRLVVVDDAQWADAASLQLLEFLAVQVRAGRLGVVITVRTGVEHAALRRTLAAIARHPGAVHRELGPLRPRDLAELSSRLTGSALDEQEAAALHERTAGNPFFATELLRLPHHRGDGVEPPLPVAVREVVERRLAPLGDVVRTTMDLAAVVGTSFDLPLLEDASGTAADDLFDALDLAVASGLAVPGEGSHDVFRFAHALVRDALLADLSPMRRQRLHARVADALQHRPRRDRALHAAELAHHLVAAVGVVGPDAAREAAEQAARTAEERLAFGDAATWWDTARGLVAAQDGADQLGDRLGIAAGRASLLAGRAEQGRAALCEVMDAATLRGDAVAAASAGVTLASAGGAWYWVAPGESPTGIVRRLERAEAMLGEEDHPLRVGLLTTTATGVYYADPARAAVLVRRALDVARRLGDPHLLAVALVGAMAGEWGPSTSDRHLELSAEVLALPADVRPAELEVAARLWRSTAHCVRGEIAEVDAELDRAGVAADLSGRQILQAQVAIARIGRAWLGSGGLDEVEAAVDRAAELHRRSGLYAEEVVPLANRALIRLQQGRLDEVAHELPAMYETGAYRDEFEAMVRLGSGDHEGAAAILAEAGAAPQTWQWLVTRVMRAMLVVECAAEGVAAAVRDDLVPHVGKVAVAGTTMSAFGPVSLHVGALDLLLGELSAAVDHLRIALATCEQQGAAMWAAVARVHLGEALLRAGEEREGRQLLERGRTEAARLGLVVAAARAAAVLSAAPAPAGVKDPSSRVPEGAAPSIDARSTSCTSPSPTPPGSPSTRRPST
jgi:DNA-binding SARP family transcriptional activator